MKHFIEQKKRLAERQKQAVQDTKAILAGFAELGHKEAVKSVANQLRRQEKALQTTLDILAIVDATDENQLDIEEKIQRKKGGKKD